jgi:hypothetical protein
MQDDLAVGEFFTNQCLISGKIRTGGRRLTDILNDARDSALELSDVQVVRIVNPKDVIAAHSGAILEKKGIVFALIREEGADVPQSSFYKHVETMEWDVFLTVPSFELSGRLHVRGTGDLRRMLFDRPGEFIPLTRAKAVFTLYPEVSFDGEVIVVNKSYIEVACTDV